MSQIFTTTLSANISTPALVKTWTADANYDQLELRILLAGLAGNGTYQACATLQLAGTGNVYQTPTTTGYCAPGVTTLWMPSIIFPISNTDVLKVYVQGLAADTSGSVQVALWNALDKTGYSLTQAFPTNFSSMSINSSGSVLAASVAVPPSDSSGVTTLLGRIVGTLDTGTHKPQSGDAYAAVVGATAIRRGVALPNLTFLMTLNRAPVTGATVTATIKKDSGSFAGTTNSVSEIGSGVYSISLTSGETTAQVITLRFTATGCDDLIITIPIGL